MSDKSKWLEELIRIKQQQNGQESQRINDFQNIRQSNANRVQQANNSFNQNNRIQNNANFLNNSNSALMKIRADNLNRMNKLQEQRKNRTILPLPVNKNLTNKVVKTNNTSIKGNSLDQEKEKIKNAHLLAKNGTDKEKTTFVNLIKQINNSGTDIQKQALKEYSNTINNKVVSNIDESSLKTYKDAENPFEKSFKSLKNNTIDTAKEIDKDLNISGISRNIGLGIEQAGANAVSYIDKGLRYISPDNISAQTAKFMANQLGKSENEVMTGIKVDGEELNVTELKQFANMLSDDNPKKYEILEYANRIYEKNRDNSVSSIFRAKANYDKTKAFDKDSEYTSNIVDLISDKWADNEDINNKRQEKIQENIKKSNNPVSKKLAEISASAGNTILGMVGSAINPILGTALFATSAGGSYYNDAKQRGMDDDQAFGYATAMGIVEGATEKFITGDMVSKLKKLATGKELSKKMLQSFGVNVAENFFQEALTEPISEVAAYAIGGEDKANFDNMKDRMLESGLDGLISGAIYAGASIGIGSAISVVNKGSKATSQEIEQAFKDTLNSGKVDMAELANGVVQGVKDNTTSITENTTNNRQTENNIPKLTDVIKENNSINENTIKRILPTRKDIKNLQNNKANNQLNDINRQITPADNKMSPNGISGQINDNIKQYSDKEVKLFLNGNNLINGVNGDLKSFTEKFYDSTTKKAKKLPAPVKTQKMFLGRINDNLAKKLNELLNNSKRFNKNYDTTDTNIVISSNNIEHIYNRHGNENVNGQIDVTPERLEKYADVVSNPDYIGVSEQFSRGKTPSIYFSKKINGYSVAVEVLSSQKQLYPETYYIFESNSKEYQNFIRNKKLKKASDMESNDLSSLDRNVQNDIPVASNNIITQDSENINKNAIKLEEKPMKEKARNYIKRSKRNFINNIVQNFQTSYFSNKDILNDTMDKLITEIEEKGKVSNDIASDIFEELYSKMTKIDEDYYNEYKNVKNEIRKTKFFVPINVRTEIADFKEFLKKNMGNLIITNDSNDIKIDTKYKELSSKYPFLFPDNIVNASDQLQRIADVQKDIVKTETNVQAYLDKTMGAEYKKWAKNDFNKALGKFVEDVNLAFRYNKDIKNNSYQIELGELKDIYKQLPYYKSQYEKILNKEVLTARDKAQVDRLIKEEITLDELPKNVNIKGITNVYNAKLPYQTLLDAIQRSKANLNSARMEEAQTFVENTDSWKDKKIGSLYNRETAKRNIYDIMQKADADRIYKKYFEPISLHEAQAIRDINRYNDMISDLQIGTTKKYRLSTGIKVSESALVQMFGEGRISLEVLRKTGVNVEKIENATKVFRTIYNELFDKLNESSIENGYNPIEKRKDDFPHFTETKPDTLLSKLASKVGIELTNQELPTDIAGITAQFKPGRKWMGNLLHRYSDITDFDALKGFDNYVRNATDIIYHTTDIKNLRAFNNAIRYNYSDKGIQEKINSIKEDNSLNELDKAMQIQELFDNRDITHLSKFVTWLNEYINSLAGKKSMADRDWEYNLGRNIYNTMNNIESKISANMIAGNVSVALTNIAPVVQARGEVGDINLLNGAWITMKNALKKDKSFANSSNFITNRRGTNYLNQTNIDKIISKITSPLNLVDDFVSETIVRAKYLQNLRNGMQQEEALKNADEYTAGLMADRSKGQLPIIFNKKNPIAKLNNMFQVEVNNQWSYYFKDLPRNSAQGKLAKAKLAYAYTKIAVGSYFFNELVNSIRGGDNRVLPDIINIIKELIKGLGNDEPEDDWETLQTTGKEVLGNIPFITFPLALLGVEDIGRIPVSGAVPDLSKLGESTFGLLSGKTNENKAKNTIFNELKKPAYYLLPKAGGAQIKKTAEAIKTMNDGGSYTIDNEGNRVLQFPTEDLNTAQKIQAGVFGKYALPLAKEYTQRRYKALNNKQTKLYEEIKLPYKQLLDYIDAGLTKTEDKINYLKSKDLTINQKWGIYKYNIFSNAIRKDGTSGVTDAEYISKNGVSKEDYINLYNKATANNIDMPTAEDYIPMKEAGLKLATYIDYKISLKKKSKNNDNVKNSDKMQILLNSNYSDKDIATIYENYISNEKDSTYNIMKNTGIDIKEYLKYKQQDFESDKEDDGTLNGKTVSGSKKKKVYEYVNSMKIDYNQKLLLLGQQYKLTNTERTKLANYVNSLKLGKQDKLDIYSKLEGFTVYKNGRVTW